MKLRAQFVFILIYGRDRQGRVLKFENDHFLVFLAAWVFFPKFWGKLRGELLEVHKIIRVSHVVSCGILFILFYV